MRVANRYAHPHLRLRLIDLLAGYFWGGRSFFVSSLCAMPPLGRENARPGQDFSAVEYPIGAIL